MRKIVWEVQYLSKPSVVKHCKKCGTKKEFICSGQFRINAQRKYLDIWLIYKCSSCNTTWNAAVYSRISPQTLDTRFLEAFHKNDQDIVEQYAMDIEFLRGNGVEIKLPQYSVRGEAFLPNESIELEIRSEYSFPIKLSSIVRDKLQLSQKEYAKLISDGWIKSSVSDLDLQRCRLKDGMILIWGMERRKCENDTENMENRN